MDSIWRKQAVSPKHFPLGYEETVIGSIIQDTNGDFVIGGGYQSFDASYPDVYTPWVARIDSTGCGEQACAAVSTETKGKGSIRKQILKIFPNPSNQYITFQLIDMSDYTPATLQIYDAQGRMIEKIDLINTYTLNTTAFPSGIYFYKYTDAEGQSIQGKFLVQH